MSGPHGLRETFKQGWWNPETRLDYNSRGPGSDMITPLGGPASPLTPQTPVLSWTPKHYPVFQNDDRTYKVTCSVFFLTEQERTKDTDASKKKNVATVCTIPNLLCNALFIRHLISAQMPTFALQLKFYHLLYRQTSESQHSTYRTARSLWGAGLVVFKCKVFDKNTLYNKNVFLLTTKRTTMQNTFLFLLKYFCTYRYNSCVLIKTKYKHVHQSYKNRSH